MYKVTEADVSIIVACKESDKMGNPPWLEDLIDMSINDAINWLEPEAYEAMAEKIREEKY